MTSATPGLAVSSERPRRRSRLVELAAQDRTSGRLTWRRIFVENGLSIVMFTFFLVFWLGQTLTGWRVYNDNRREHGGQFTSLEGYVWTGHFLEATSENWESEFLQMSAFVWLTSFLYQRGSPESKDPYEEDEDNHPVTEESPWPARRGGWVLKLYANSLSITFFLLFLVCFALHIAGGAHAYNEDQLAHGELELSMGQYLRSSQFWFESFQNWQSEFLSIGAMVVLGVFLRQRGSPESKPVQAPHASNE